MQPLRFLIPLGVFSILPFSFLIDTLGSFRKNKMKYAILICFLILAIFIQAFLTIKLTEPFKEEGYPKITSEFPKAAEQLINDIKTHTNTSGRILIEDADIKSLGYGGHRFGGHLISLFPLYTKREFIGGPHPAFPLKQHFAEFTNGKLFQKSITTFNSSLLKDYFDLYNIKWVIAWSNESKEFLDAQHPYISKIKEIGEFTFYEVNRTPSFFIKGEGNINVSYDSIKLSNITGEEIILKYHYLKTLKVKPELKIEPIKILDDPVGFIKITNDKNVSEILIYN
jgi:hypothetical protein